MDLQTLGHLLEDPAAGAEWLRRLGVVDVGRAARNLVSLARSGLTPDLLLSICRQLAECLPACADPDMALNNLDRFVAAARSALALGGLFERDPQALATLVQIFSTSQYLSDVLVSDPESFDLLRLTEGKPVGRQALIDDVVAEVEALDHELAVLRALRRFKRREMLRIAYGDIVCGQSLHTVTTQISFLADAILEGALRAAGRRLGAQRGTPLHGDGQPAHFVVLGLGKLGGRELNYSSDIDLVFLYDEEGRTGGPRSVSNSEFFEQLAREIVRLVAEPTDLGAAYRVDVRLRPEGKQGALAVSEARALHYYDTRGRTWERQAYIKARPVAGCLELGGRFLEGLDGWVYRRYLTQTEIAGIKDLKRRIDEQTRKSGLETRNVKTGRGGIRDIEFVIQFLQLLNGADLPNLRTGNTLEAIAQLECDGCLTHLERGLLQKNYTFLRRIEHHLQIMFDLRTHVLPRQNEELRKLALRMGYAEGAQRPALEAFLRDYRVRTEENRRILDHLLQEAFEAQPGTAPEVDLVLDPEPQPERIEEVLGRYGFSNVEQAYRNLMSLAEEKLQFLSTRRCRHFLAAIAPQLLREVAETPDPDATLVNFSQVSDSLGGKAVLWELFSFNPPSLRLYVELCAYSPYLCNMLVGNPGMVDELMDSLVLDRLPTPEFLAERLAELTRGAEDLEPILHSFKNAQQLRVGVRDLLGREDIQAATGALSDIAEACLSQIVARQLRRLVARFGEPRLAEGRKGRRPCELVVLAMGKFGGREMNYQSDLDLVFLYQGDGHTAPSARNAAGERTTNQHFFSELGQRIVNTTGRLGPYGRLYPVDMRLRPTGRSGALATSLAQFARYFAEGQGQLWERQALCKARVVFGSRSAARAVLSAVNHAAFQHPWRPEDAEAIHQMRMRLEKTAGTRDFKRGPGGIVDIEFAVQLLQLRHGRRRPRVRCPNTLEALERLYTAGCLNDQDYQAFAHSYRLLRTLESRLCLMGSPHPDELPEDSRELKRLKHLTGHPTAGALVDDLQQCSQDVRRRFERLVEEAAAGRRSRTD